MGELEKRIEELTKLHYGPKDFLGKQCLSIALSDVLEFVAEMKGELWFPLPVKRRGEKVLDHYHELLRWAENRAAMYEKWLGEAK